MGEFDDPTDEMADETMETPGAEKPDAKRDRIISEIETLVGAIRRRGHISVIDGYQLRDLAVECGWTEPKPGLEPEELKAIVRLARAAPTENIGAYVEQLRKDIAAWTKASRETASMGVLSTLAMGAFGIGAAALMNSLFAKKGGK